MTGLCERAYGAKPCVWMGFRKWKGKLLCSFHYYEAVQRHLLNAARKARQTLVDRGLLPPIGGSTSHEGR